MIKRLIVIFLTLLLSYNAQAEEWPKLSGAINLQACQETFQIAKSVFHSNSKNLNLPLIIPPNISSKVVLQAKEGDISGGHGVEADLDEFDEIPLNHACSRPIYWQKIISSNHRLALNETCGGDEGDRYALYYLPETTTPEEFNSEYQKNYQNIAKIPFKIILPEQWFPPFIMKSENGNLWAVDVGFSKYFQKSWQIFVADEKTNEPNCKIDFWPEDSISLLPPSVKKFSQLLLGFHADQEMGTLQPTAGIKLKVKNLWAYVAVRPWAMEGMPVYNSRKVVDTNLKYWSKPVKERYNLYNNIYTLYPTAEKDLRDYYIRKFGKSKSDALQMAHKNLDLVFRSNFKFHEDN